jgi:probable RcsB/C two-component-system connector
MKNNADERMTDIVIGEAIMQLVNAGEEISWRAVTEALQHQMQDEQDSERVTAMRGAIAKVTRELRSRAVSSGFQMDRPAAGQLLH